MGDNEYRKRVFLWESMCGMFQNRFAFKRYEIDSPKKLLSVYLKRQARAYRGEYVCYCINNPKESIKIATDVFNYRNNNWGALVDWDMIDLI